MSQSTYYVPHETRLPVYCSAAIFLFVLGFSLLLNRSAGGLYTMAGGTGLFLLILFLWFRHVVKESESGQFDSQVDLSFRMGMGWFIFTEVMFFAVFFGSLLYARSLAGPWLGGEGSGGAALTNDQLWPGYLYQWPNNGPGAVGGSFTPMAPWGVPAINTAILLTSGVTVTLAHHAVLAAKRIGFVFWLFATVALGFTFIGLQVFEYIEAYSHLNLKLGTGIYGTTFYMLTGFHGFHVTLGAVMLTVIMLRALAGHFSSKNHFGFEAAAWYWHFVDVVWLGLFLFVYVF